MYGIRCKTVMSELGFNIRTLSNSTDPSTEFDLSTVSPRTAGKLSQIQTAGGENNPREVSEPPQRRKKR